MVKLTRSQDGFGFSIVGGKDNVPPLPITIKQVFENGTDHRDGLSSVFFFHFA